MRQRVSSCTSSRIFSIDRFSLAAVEHA